MDELAITVIGRDRPGIIADVAEVLAGLGMNLTDSTMTRLRGHFAMTLVCTGSQGGEAVEEQTGSPALEDVEAALAPLAANGSLVTTVSRVRPEPAPESPGGHYVLSVHGADRLGIVASVARGLAEFGGNITDLTTRLSGDLYVLVAELDLPAGADVDLIHERLDAVARALGVDVALRPAETDVL
ncbi:amino acid-binding protein [Planosporangium flavigriseum]|uniref:Amino acid-binding protein n=1 Tax=Planosporangium flavigriseum TaxID=373681 RepID=A0A8J3LQV5_9ACTN|nr:ACT domain-containing protein [Planosporangium flavigriseum]NJC63873.1 amino acid-binding protein [Planosporangium flavigriseum]GIG75899.1 amino acid-binding protein [Planosporangium flavigriseum]